ncbi:MAG: hypothetical protein JNL28_00525 [Planctomycetes bacterium]|nr:hypothetical protein [Planctomycetota bacterium]
MDDAPAQQFKWTTPKGWTELAPATMRVANFKPAGDERAECYVTMLAGDAGGLTANINRWRGQLSLGPLSAAAIEALPRATLFGSQATLVEWQGKWQGMSGAEARDDWALTGLLLIEPAGSLFVKMTGPSATVAAEREAFLAFAASFGSGAQPTHTSESAASGFEFVTPATWRRAPDRASRALSFWAGDGEAVECYVTVLSGEAGGELANVNRWRGQLGLAPIAQTDLDQLDSITLCGRPAKIVDIDGASGSMIGVTCMNSTRSVFIKMTGPGELVRAQRSALLTFAASLQEAQ